MNSILKNKLQYLFYTPFVWLILVYNGIKNKGVSFWNGIPYFMRTPGSIIKINKGCRFASRRTGNPTGINHKCMFTTLSRKAVIEIGEHCGMSGVAILCASKVCIHDYVRCGANVTIMDTDGHEEDFRSGKSKPISIEDHVWLGANVIVMKDVTIGRYAMVGIGSIIRSSVPPYSITIGNPAKVVGFSKIPEEIIEFEKKYYPEEERLPLELLEKNYNKYFLKRLKEIKEFTKI